MTVSIFFRREVMVSFFSHLGETYYTKKIHSGLPVFENPCDKVGRHGNLSILAVFSFSQQEHPSVHCHEVFLEGISWREILVGVG